MTITSTQAWTPSWYRTDNRYVHSYANYRCYSASVALRNLIDRMERIGGFIQRIGWMEYRLEWHGTEIAVDRMDNAIKAVRNFEADAMDLIRTIVEDCRTEPLIIEPLTIAYY